jgi:2-C-methyl-D-erythritol 4-phosphate cytidylyltransferase
MRTVGVVLAGGSGQRFGGDVPKQLRELSGQTLIEHCVSAFERAPSVDEILVVMTPGQADLASRALAKDRFGKLTGVIEGGRARPDSTRQAIGALSAASPAADCNVLFHDAARPLVDQRIIADCVRALATGQAVGVAVPCSDTIVEVRGGAMTSMLRRDVLQRCQTPQGFRLSVIRRAYQLADADPEFATASATDDCGIVLRYLPEVPVLVVPGSERNIKITHPGDLRLAELLLPEQA